jgi:hypothetical protein
VGQIVKDAKIDESTNELPLELSDGLPLVVRLTRHEATDDPPDWELITPEGLALEFGPGVRWQIAGAGPFLPPIDVPQPTLHRDVRPVRRREGDATERTATRAMREDRPEFAFLGASTWGSPRRPMLVQYWRSFEQLEAYARNRDAAHWPAWARSTNASAPMATLASGTRPTSSLPAATSASTTMPAIGLGEASLVPAAGQKQEPGPTILNSA